METIGEVVMTGSDPSTVVLLVVVLGLLIVMLGSVMEALVAAIAALAMTAVGLLISIAILVLVLMSRSDGAQPLSVMLGL
jgi:hypothetical protein